VDIGFMGNLVQVSGHVPEEDGKGSEIIFKGLGNKETLLEIGESGFLEVDGRFLA
jgi:hypothetical protein